MTNWPAINFVLNIAMLVVVIYHLYWTSTTPKVQAGPARCLITGGSTCLLLTGADIERLDLCEQCRERLLERAQESSRV